MRILMVTGLALRLAACATSGLPRNDAGTPAQSGSTSDSEMGQQMGGGSGM